MSSKLEITPIPSKKNSNFKHFPSGVENSSTMTSEQAIYMNVPAAKHPKMISTISSQPCNTIPMMMPIGVNKAKVESREITN